MRASQTAPFDSHSEGSRLQTVLILALLDLLTDPQAAKSTYPGPFILEEQSHAVLSPKYFTTSSIIQGQEPRKPVTRHLAGIQRPGWLVGGPGHW